MGVGLQEQVRAVERLGGQVGADGENLGEASIGDDPVMAAVEVEDRNGAMDQQAGSVCCQDCPDSVGEHFGTDHTDGGAELRDYGLRCGRAEEVAAQEE